MEESKKPSCKFGAKCYRKNPKHFDVYSHPSESDVEQSSLTSEKKNKQIESTGGRRMKQTTLRFSTKNSFSSAPESLNVENDNEKVSFKEEKKQSESDRNNTTIKTGKLIKLKRKRKDSLLETKYRNSKGNKKAKATNDYENTVESDEISEADSEPPTSSSWVFISNKSNETQKTVSSDGDLKNKTVEELIKTLFLVDMPPDFYSFYEFYKTVEESHKKNDLQVAGLKLVGPFEILSGVLNCSVERDLFLCHWRFYYDPPEFQTVLVADSGFHFGYWRDDPKETPVFLASNDPNKDCIFKIEAENIFGSVYHYLNDLLKNSDPFKKVNITKLQSALSNWAEKNKFTLEKKTNKMNMRQKKVVSKTFHRAGIVVPVEAKTELGYRPLIETDAKLKRICNLIIDSKDENEKEILWENLQPLITAANIANDECDFGNSLELGIDLFCMGSAVFHETIEHLLSTAYSLLNRTEFEKIIQAHLKFRRKGNNMSIYNLN